MDFPKKHAKQTLFKNLTMLDQTMKSIRRALFLLMLIPLLQSCGNKQAMTVSNQLTTFIPEEKLIPIEIDEKKKIEKSTGNFLRDAIKIIHSDKRTQGYFSNISLVNSAIYPDNFSYTFSGVTASTINDFPATTTQQIVVTIEQEQEALFYELSFGANP